MKQQRGGTLLGFIIGAVVGLGAALAVAVYVTKVPIPFVNKGQTRSADQDVEESRKNKDWDPNAPLYGKNPAKPVAPAADAAPTASVPPVASSPTLPGPGPEAKSTGAGVSKARSGGSAVEPFIYFVQVGAFRNAEDAETHRAKLSLGGVEARVTEREQSGRAVFRVRVGPFDRKEDADKSKEKMESNGLDTALVRVAR